MSEKENEKNPAATPKTTFTSRLNKGREKFLAHAIEHGLDIGTRTSEDFIRHFSPAAIMTGLEDRPVLRAKILVATTGIKNKIASKKSAGSSGEDLQIALDEGETDAKTVIEHFDPDDRVRFLEHKALWTYVTEGEFWKVERKDEEAFARSKRHIAFMLNRALVDKLLTHTDIVEGITVQTLATLLPRTELETLISAVLKAGREGSAYTDTHFFDEIPTTTIVQHVPLPLLWNKIVVPLVAQAHDFDDAPDDADNEEPDEEEVDKESDDDKETVAADADDGGDEEKNEEAAESKDDTEMKDSGVEAKDGKPEGNEKDEKAEADSEEDKQKSMSSGSYSRQRQSFTWVKKAEDKSSDDNKPAVVGKMAAAEKPSTGASPAAANANSTKTSTVEMIKPNVVVYPPTSK